MIDWEGRDALVWLRRVRGIVALLATACAPAALAGGPAFSGIAAPADSPETAVSNPAGMTRLDGAQFEVRTVVGNGIGNFEVDESQTTMSGGNPRDGFSPVVVPAGFYVRPLDDRWRVGLSLTVPSGFGADYGPHWAGRYYTDDYSLVYVALTPAVAYRVDDRLSLGVAVNVNYTSSTTQVAINTLAPGAPDGRLEAELSGVGASVTVSMLWEFDARNRFGLTYTSEAKANLEGDLNFHDVGPVLGPILQATNLNGANIKVENILPQHVIAGFYHEADSGWYATIDALWVDFSKFATGTVSLDGTDLQVDDGGGFQDFSGVTVGFGLPCAGYVCSAGAFYVTSPVSNADRTLALALDRMWGVGVGISIPRANSRKLEVDFNVVNFGDAPVDTGPSLARGRVVGKTDDPYAIAIDASYRF